MKKKKKPPKKKKINGVNEEDFLEAIEKVTKKLKYKFKFGYHEAEDMKQQAIIFAIQGLKFYDHKRPLENFLWTHVRNRLFNFKRDNYQRPDSPCTKCPLFDPKYQKSLNQCEKYTERTDCEPFSIWYKKNNTKKNIMNPIDITNTNNTCNIEFAELIKNKEILEIIDKNIPIKLRPVYLNLLSGQKIAKKNYDALVAQIKIILNIPGEKDE